MNKQENELSEAELDELIEAQRAGREQRRAEAVKAAVMAHKREEALEVGPKLEENPDLIHVRLDSAIVGKDLPGHVLLKRLPKESFTRFKATMFSGSGEQKAMASRQAVLDALVYPSREKFAALEKVSPGIPETCSDPLLKIVRAEAEAEQKK